MTEPDMVVGNHFNSYDHYMYINDFTCTIVECIYTTKKKNYFRKWKNYNGFTSLKLVEKTKICILCCNYKDIDEQLDFKIFEFHQW